MGRPRFAGLALTSSIAIVLASLVVTPAAGATPQRFGTLQAAVGSGVVDAKVVSDLQGNGQVDALLTLDWQGALAQAKTDAPLRAGVQRTASILAATRPVYQAEKDAALAGVGGASVLRDFGALPVSFVHFTSNDALLAVANSSNTLSIEPNEQMKAQLAESLPLIDQPTAQAASHTGAGTAVAVLDTGVDYTRSAFGPCSSPGGACKVAYTRDFARDDGSLDDNGHGTNVSGIVLGVAPGTKILGLDVFSGNVAYGSDIISAVNWVVSTQATYNTRAMNLSLGDSSFHTTECSNSGYAASFASARAVGVLPVVAAGNAAMDSGYFRNGVSDPACAPGAVRVGAVYDSGFGSVSWGVCTDATAADKITCFSQGGPLLTLLAPGSKITAAGLTMSGTSQATPHATGAAAVLAGASPAASLAQITNAMASTGPSIYDSRTGLTHHRLSLWQAVQSLGGGGGGTPSLSINDASVVEGNSGTTNENLTVTLSAAASTTVTVGYATADGTATKADGDYQSASGTLAFTSGQTSRTLSVAVNGDAKVEPAETFYINLSGAVGATIADGQGVGTITNDDSSQGSIAVTGQLLGGYGTSGGYQLYHAYQKGRYQGAVSPNHSGQTLHFEVERYANGSWVARATADAQLDSSSRVVVYWRAHYLSKGTYRLACEFAGDADHGAAQSAWSYFKVTS